MIAYDVYAGVWTSRGLLTREHIIPQCIMKKVCAPGVHDIENIAYTSMHYNSLRSNYRFVGYFGTQGRDIFVVDKKSRVCYPGPARLIVGEACRRMMEKYPLLDESIHHFIDPDAYIEWTTGDRERYYIRTQSNQNQNHSQIQENRTLPPSASG